MPSTATTGAARDVLLTNSGGLSPEDLDAISRALTDVVIPLSEAWTELVGSTVEITVSSVAPGPVARPADAEPEPGVSFLDPTLGDSSFAAIGWFGGELGTALLVVAPPLGLVVVDLLLGGTGRPAGERDLSAIDLDLLASITAPTFGTLRRIGGPERLGEPVPLLTDLEEPDLEARLAAGAMITFDVAVAEHRQPLVLVLGASGARHLAGAVTATPVETPADRSREMIEGLLVDVVVEAVVAFPPVLVPSHRILRLGVGDVIGLGSSTDEPLPLRVDGRPFASVLPARAGGDVACQVVATALDAIDHHSPTPGPGGSL